ncbi:MAG: T9SS type A sorting domain-containing protein [Bacteroidetes bacterium]|nr:T9SS type A sorting domain-containing protein [Bacteroidota bacterium]
MYQLLLQPRMPYVFPCTGIDPVADLSNNFLLYPNPSTGLFNVDMTIPGSGSTVHLNVYDMTGRQVYDRTCKMESDQFSHGLSFDGFLHIAR